jgi:hypothetical protein
MKATSKSAKPPVPLLAEAMARFPDEKNTPFSIVLRFIFKRAAKHLVTHLNVQHGVKLSHGQALDALSASLGFADWNTANAVVELADEREAAMAPAPVPAAPPAPRNIHRLTHLIDFSTSGIVVGPAGCGKSVGLLFAVQRARALEQGRPVVIVRGPESRRYQPNWGNALSLFDGVEVREQIDPDKAVSVSDKLDVCMADGLWGLDAVDRERHHQEVVSDILQWLERRAHLNPLVLVEEAPSVLGPEANRLVREAPDSVTFIWTAQCLKDAGEIETLRARFANLYLMRGSERSAAAELSRLVHEDSKQVLAAVSALGVGDAVQLPIRSMPLPA